jgi:lysyl-tRNA synthetase class 2
MSREYSNLEKVRLEKVERLRGQDVDLYPAHSERSHTSQEAILAYEASETSASEQPVEVTLVGRLRSLRPMGKITFAHIEDGAGRVQLFLRANDIGQDQLDSFNRDFDLGDFVQASGEMFRTRTGEVTLRVNNFLMLAKAITPLPAAKDELVEDQVVQHATLAEPEVRYRQRYADLAVNPEVRRIFQTRATVLRSLREFMDGNGFLEVETPILQPIYGGAAARPFVTYHNQLKQELYLRISFELYLKRLLVGNLERVYEIGRDFRNEGVDRTHNPEFTMLEFYMAYADYSQVMSFTEEMIVSVADKVAGSRKISYQGHEIDLEPPWARMQLSQGLKDMAGIDIAQYPTAEDLAEAMRAKGLQPDLKSTRGKLIESLLSNYLEPNLIQPTIIYDYPRDISPLTKSKPDDPNTVERFEAFMAGMEICNAFSELNDPLDQEARFLEMGRDYEADDEERHPMDEDYLRAMRYGMPPNGGFGLGIDRLVMLFTDTANIREVILFPHLRERD